jgi:cation:H+ antiporter
MATDVLVLLLGLGCAAVGGELFVRAAVGLATWARIAPGIIGATVVAFATSSPEFAVGVGSATSGTPNLALGDALGSNVVNIGLVLGTMLTLGAVTTARTGIRRDGLTALALPIVLVLLVIDGRISRVDGIVLIVVFVGWLALTTLEARRERSAAEMMGERDHGRVIVTGLVGVGLLIAAGRLIVAGAKPLGVELGLDPFVVGVVIVAIGTSAPELATAIISRLRGHGEIGLGTVIGSNIFNGGVIIGLVATIRPFEVSVSEIRTNLVFGIGLMVLLGVLGPKRLSRQTGVVLITIYIASIVTLLLTAEGH